MSKEEKFKKTLQQLLDERQFAFEEGDWDAAKKVIDENRRKRRFLPLWFVFTGLVIFTGTLMVWPDEKSDLQGTDNFDAYTKPALVQNTATPVLKKNSSLAEPSEHHPAKQNAGSVAENRPNSFKASTPLADKKPGLSDVSQTKVAASTSEQNTSPLNHTAETSKEEQRPPLSELPMTPLVESIAPEKNTPVLTEVTSGELLATATPVSSLTSESPLPVAEEKTNPAVAAVSETPIQKDSSEAAPVESSALSLPEVKKKMLWSVEAGFNVLYGWSSPAGAEGRGFNPVLGVNYHNAITDRFDYSLGLHFTSIAHLGAYSDTSKITKYNFGEESQVTVISPQTFYYLNVPLRFSWNFSNKQSLGTALELGYLLNVKSTVETYEESFTTGEKQSTEELGYTEGVAPFNFQMGFFYRRELFKNLYIQPELFFGLVDLKDDVFFKYNGKERSSGLKLTLLYSIKNR